MDEFLERAWYNSLDLVKIKWAHEKGQEPFPDSWEEFKGLNAKSLKLYRKKFPVQTDEFMEKANEEQANGMCLDIHTEEVTMCS